jgi:hypothetical protein
VGSPWVKIKKKKYKPFSQGDTTKHPPDSLLITDYPTEKAIIHRPALPNASGFGAS